MEVTTCGATIDFTIFDSTFLTVRARPCRLHKFISD